MLASGCALNWNNGNTLCSILAARAMVETAALFMEFETRLDDLLRCSDIDGIDALINNRTFASKDEEFLETWPDNRATNILTFIDKIDKATLPRMREHYDWLSERCHPNSFGHFLFFGDLDTKTGAATLRWKKRNGGGFGGASARFAVRDEVTGFTDVEFDVVLLTRVCAPDPPLFA